MSTQNLTWLTDPNWREQAKSLYDQLPEHQRRWFAALVSQQLGYGGIKQVCELFKINDGTVRIGRNELTSGLGDRSPTQIRRPGAGRRPIEEVDPKAEEELLNLIETAGDPCSSRKWVRQTPRRLAETLRQKGHKISRETVRRLLKKRDIRSAAIASASQAPATPTETSSSDT